MENADELKSFFEEFSNNDKARVATKREQCKWVYSNYEDNPEIAKKLPILCEYFKLYPPSKPYYSSTTMNYFDGALYRTFWMKYH